jgi:hypothetical protein
MDLVNQDYPEQYCVFYDVNRHAFRFHIEPNLSQTVLRLLIQQRTHLAYHSEQTFGVDSFECHGPRWGYGECIHILPDLDQRSWVVWECVVDFKNHQPESDEAGKILWNIICSISVLLEALETCTYQDIPFSASITPSEPIQLATIHISVRPQVHYGCCISSTLSKGGRKVLEGIVTSDQAEKRALFYKTILTAMKDLHQVISQEKIDPSRYPLFSSSHEASQEFLSVHLYGKWRIYFECIGASLCVTPKYDEIGEDRGAELEPHNTDGPMEPLVLLAGLVSCYERLYPALP